MSGKLFLIVGPSGVGKGTLIAELKKRHPEYFFPLSYTTRTKRPKEKEGQVYHFISKTEFQKKIATEEFLEWAVVHNDNYYGTDKKTILENLAQGRVIIREVDIQGFESIREKIAPDQLRSIFIAPPDLPTLIARIKRRAPISQTELEKRMISAKIELAKDQECDYLVVSEEGKIASVVRKMEKIIEKEMAGESN